MLVLIAWRNIWRNKLRSLLLIFSIALGLWASLFFIAWGWGMNAQRINSAIRNEVSHIQIHHPEFKKDQDEKYLITNTDSVEAYLSSNDSVKAFAGRLLFKGMVASSRGTSGVLIRGIDPENESLLTGIDQKIKEGEYFKGVKTNPVLISQRLAEKMNLKLKSKIVLNFQDKEGNIAAGAFRVAGIYKTGNLKLDEMNVFVRNQDLRALSGYSSGYHEVGLLLHDAEKVPGQLNKLKVTFPELSIESWRQIAPDLDLMVSSFDQIMNIFMVIILLGLAFGIINTMLMAVLERTRELGMLMAVGMNKIRVFTMISLETVFLVLVGAPIGLLAAFGTIAYYGSVGIDLSTFSEGLEFFGMDTMTYPALKPEYYIRMLVLVVITAFAASIYPSIKALKLKPAEAVRAV